MLGVRHADEALEVVQAGGIHEGDFAHSDDADAGFVAHAVHDVVELVGDAEEEGAVDFIDFDARREVQLLLVVMDFAFVGEVDLIARYGDLRRLGDTFHEEEHGYQEANLDGNRQVEDNGQEEGCYQHRHVALRVLHQRTERPPLAHVIGYDDQNSCEASHRDVFRQRPEEKQDEQEDNGVHNTGDRRFPAIVDVRHRAGDGSGYGDTAEEGDYDIRRTLGNQFGIGIMLVARNTICHSRREQGFDGAQDGYRKGRGEKEVYHLHIKLNRRGLGHGCLDGKAVADGFDAGEVEIRPPHIDCHRHHNDSHQRTGHPLRKLRGQDNDDDAQQSDSRREPVDRRESPDVGNPFRDEIRRHLVHRQPEEVFDLRRENRQGDSAREADDDGVGDKLDDRPQLQRAHDDQQDARHDRRDGQSLEPEVLDDAIYNNNKGSRRPSDLDGAAAEQRNHESADDGGNQTLFGTHARGDTECNGQRQGDDAHDDARHQVCHEFFFGISLQRRE